MLSGFRMYDSYAVLVKTSVVNRSHHRANPLTAILPWDAHSFCDIPKGVLPRIRVEKCNHVFVSRHREFLV